MISETWGYGVANNKSELRLNNKREAFLKDYEQRLNIVQLECRDALKVIQSRDRENSFFYIDPPYFNSDCAHYGGYTKDDFRALLLLLSNIKGKFLLSSYPSDVLGEFQKRFGWHQISFDKTLSVGKSGKRKVEVLTANYPIALP